MTLVEMVLKLLLALVVGGLVGLERERRDRPAGLRTHMLVCAGSTLITLVSMMIAVGETGTDRSRIAAQIVSGIGFLGAGTIFRSGAAVRGLTTAAGLWVVAGIGMAIAVGHTLLQVAVIAAVLIFVVNALVRHLEDRVVRVYSEVQLTLTRDDTLTRVLEALDSRGIQVDAIRWMRDQARDGEEAHVRMRLRLPPRQNRSATTLWLSAMPGVQNVDWV